MAIPNDDTGGDRGPCKATGVCVPLLRHKMPQCLKFFGRFSAARDVAYLIDG